MGLVGIQYADTVAMVQLELSGSWQLTVSRIHVANRSSHTAVYVGSSVVSENVGRRRSRRTFLSAPSAVLSPRNSYCSLIRAQSRGIGRR